MNFKIIIFLLITGSLSSCNWRNGGNKKPAITKDTLTYSFKTYKQRATDCGYKPDSSCTIVKINYPEFSGQKTLNDSITGKFNLLFGDNKKPDTSLKQIADSFMGEYLNFRQDRPKSTLFFLLDAHAKVLRQDSSLTTVEVSGYSYTGGAHGTSYTYFINWDTKANKNIGLNNILVAGNNTGLTKTAEPIFRANEKLTDTSSLNNQHDYFFKDGKFSLPDDYLLTPFGIRFLYNIYTIKPYAAGPTELIIPYSQIKSLLKPNTVLAQYIK
jgi:Deacetylase PdaC/Protein of unknown function (DUF3298)